MNGWQPLAPTRSSNGAYSKANGETSTAGAAGGGGVSSRFKANATSSSTDPKQLSVQERRANILRGPSDPFPPVGPFPRSVAVRILSYLSISQQRTCALAGRSLARAVADESNWSRRLDALDWCNVDGLNIVFEKDDAQNLDERQIGQRRKGKQKQQQQQQSLPDANAANDAGVKSATHSLAPTPVSMSRQTTADDDDFGDFAGPSTFSNVNFENFKYDAPPSGGSFASGKASVAIGAGKPHAFATPANSAFAPLVPVKLGAGLSSNRTSLAPPAPNGSIFSYSSEASLPLCSASPSFRQLRAYAKALKSFLKSLFDTSAPATNSLIFTCDLGLSAQTALLANLLRFISTSVGGGPQSLARASTIEVFASGDDDKPSARAQDAAHHLLNNLISSFEGTLARRGDAVRAATHGADTARAIRRAEDDMHTHANGVWELGNARLALALSESEDFENVNIEDQFGRMKAAKLFLDQCDILNKGLAKHSPLDNVVEQKESATLDFTAMDTFIADLLEIIKADGQIIARIFPHEQDVLLAYADRVAQDVIARYVQTLLDHTRTLSPHLYLRSCAATFAQSWKITEVLLAIEPRDDTIVTQERCEDVVFNAWETNMDDYLSVENEWVHEEMQAVTEKWETDVKNDRVDAAFLASQNPAAVKRSVLSGFKDVLLLPVTVVPRAAGVVGGAVIRTAGTGLSTLNPLRWQSGNAASVGNAKATLGSELGNKKEGRASNTSLPKTPTEAAESGYMDFSNAGAIGTMDSDDESEDGLDMNEKDEWDQEVAAWSAVASKRPKRDVEKAVKPGRTAPLPASPRSPSRPLSVAQIRPFSPARTATPDGLTRSSNLKQMQLLLSLDTALQVIHVNRDCLRRIETFVKYPDPYGQKVRDAMQDVSLLLFRALGEGHIAPGFEEATKQIQAWKPEEHNEQATQGDPNEKLERQEVEPLVHFFELVHVGDTIAQMVQVYFDQEMSRHIDKNDFLNPVVKARKRFEGQLDESVARGLNAGVDLLLGQAEYIISTRQQKLDYNPAPGQLNDLTPTAACKEAVECLRLHCRMLIGSTDKNVLEVFYQEVGIRLHTIICKHLKRQVISLDGGFRVIADLNEYHAFIASLRQSVITADFESLKMLGNLYIIDNPKELAKLARDANMFGGQVSPEDLYEFLQARADFRRIEKAIDKEMYGFKVSEDCCVC